MHLQKATIAGGLGALAMTVSMSLMRALGVPIELERLLGAALAGDVGRQAWLVGLGAHVLGGCSLGLLYALVFDRVVHRSGVAEGAGLGLAHAAVAGLLLALVPLVHPLVPGAITAPGVFLANEGAAAVAGFVAVHMVFGAVVGALYDLEGHELLHVRWFVQA